MASIDDARLDALLAGAPLPAPPEALVQRVRRRLSAATGDPRAAASWRERLEQVTEQFRAALAAPQPALLAVAVRGERDPAVEVTDAPDAALVHTARGGTVHGQVFLAGLESPEGFEVELRRGADLVAEELTDATGRFAFEVTEPGDWRLEVPALGLSQALRLTP